MKRLLTILFVLALVIVGVGFYQGWFTLSSPEPDQGNQININLEIDKDKMKEDADSLKNKAKDLTDNVTGRDQETVDE